MATPGSTAATSRRESPTAPATPVAIAAMRSMTVGEVREVICELVEQSMSGTTKAATTPISTTTTAPRKTNRPARIRSRFTMPSAMPMIGVESGAMIIAPMTVAVESARTPAVAMIPESTSIVQNADCFARVSPDRRSRSSDSSSRVRRWFSGRTRSRRPMFMAPSMPSAAAGGRWVRGDAPGRPCRPAASHAGTVDDGGRHAQVPHHPHRRTVAVLAVVATGLAGCSDDEPPSPTPTLSSPTRRRPPTRPSRLREHRDPRPRRAAPTPSSPGSVPAGFSLDDVSSPSYPNLGGDLGAIGLVRVGRHTGYDRVVWEFPGTGRPSFQVHYVDEPIADGSGDLVDVPGDAYLEVMISSVGIPAADAPRPGNASAASIAGTVIAQARPVYGGFEAVGQSFVGVRDRQRPFKVSVLRNPTRLVVDVSSG